MKLKDQLLLRIRSGEELPRSAQFRLIALLGLPAILAQFSTIVMQYIDAAMVGRLGADPAAAVGIVTTTTWLFGGLCFSAGDGLFRSGCPSDWWWRFSRRSRRAAYGFQKRTATQRRPLVGGLRH